MRTPPGSVLPRRAWRSGEWPRDPLLSQCLTVLGTEDLVSPVWQTVLSYRLMMSPDRGFILSLHPFFEPCELSVLIPAQQEAVTPELPFTPLSPASSQTLLALVRSWLFGTELFPLPIDPKIPGP